MRLRVVFNAVDAEATGSQRLLAPLKELSNLGLVETQPLNLDDARSQIKWADILVLQCLAGPQHFEMITKFKEAGVAVVIDYDDNFAVLPVHVLKYLNLIQSEVTANWIKYLKLADVVTCPCPYLEKTMVEYSPYIQRTRILPNYLTTEEYEGARNYTPREDGETRILYSCSTSHMEDFKWVSSLLMWLGKRHPEVKLVTQGIDLTYHYPEYSGKAVHELPAPYAVYHQRLREISPHICIGPLLDNEHAKCRSDIKYLQTASVKAAFVGSSLPPYTDTVKHGETGFLAGNKVAWWWRLRTLIINPEFRRMMGQNAYEHAGKFVLKDHIHKWYDLYQSLI